MLMQFRLLFLPRGSYAKFQTRGAKDFQAAIFLGAPDRKPEPEQFRGKSRDDHPKQPSRRPRGHRENCFWSRTLWPQHGRPVERKRPRCALWTLGRAHE